MEHVFGIFGTAALSGAIVAVANSGFDRAWGAPHFFIIWVIMLVVVYGGFLILGDDGVDW